jgi:putative colanic acid biosynthesis glycosyltransferase
MIRDKISIVTVTYNDVSNLRKTVESVVSQHYRNKEFVIIDGGSTDGTREYLMLHQKQIDAWISESDQGIYDAMNKGSRKATGEWIIFLNSGDVFSNDHVLENVFSANIPEEVDVIYGDTVYSYGKEEYKEFRKSNELRNFWKGMVTSHQSFFIRKRIMDHRQFDTRYKIASDFNQLYTLLMDGGLFVYKKLYISRVDTTGISNNKRIIQSVLEHWSIIHHYSKIGLSYHLYYVFRTLIVLLLSGVKLIIPGRIYIQFIRVLRCKDRDHHTENAASVIFFI